MDTTPANQMTVEEVRRERTKLESTSKVIPATAIALFAISVFLYISFPTSLWYGQVPTYVEDMNFVIGIASFAVLIAYVISRSNKLNELFWKELAALYGYTYVRAPYFTGNALMFREGHNRRTGHGLSGTMEDRPFRLFEYQYVTGSGKSTRTHSYVVFEVIFEGTFPHIYLNNEYNGSLSGLKELFMPRLMLPPSLDKKFNLYAPKGYEIEALEIFTPEVLALIMDEGWGHDTELTGNALYVFVPGQIRTKSELDGEIERLRKMVALLAPRLNRFKLTPIGDLRHTL